jgi:integrase
VAPVVTLPTDRSELDALIDAFVARYTNRQTRRMYRTDLALLFASTGRRHPDDLTEADVLAWCAGNGRHLANNTVRSRLSHVRTFLRWAVRTGHTTPRLADALADRDNPLTRSYPRLYGKRQGKFPARWLSHHEAFGRLIGTCSARTNTDLRDELVLRLGLAGLRAAEIISLRLRSLDLDTPTLQWIGKANRPGTIVPGSQLVALLREYLGRYSEAVGRPLTPDDPLICRQKPGAGAGEVSWGQPIAQTCSVRRIVTLRADAASLGHLSPHDLRRTAAGILHHATDEHGAHHFDLLDIQRVLDHADPATTMRSYLKPIDTATKQRAAHLLD